MAHGIVSADSHVMEPADLWKTRLDAALRDRAPEVVRNPDPEGPAFLLVAEGAPPFPVAASFAAGRGGEELAEFLGRGYEAARPSGWDPVERIADQELDGIDAELLYPSLGMSIFSVPDPELQRACFRVYNDWLAEYCSHEPRRLYGVGLISLESLEHATGDLERVAAQGMRGAMIWGATPEDRSYRDRAYDPFWQAASEHGLPVSLHIATRRRLGQRSQDFVSGPGGKRQVDPAISFTTMVHEIQESLAILVFGGVLERFPELRIVSAENGIGWLLPMMHRMDHGFEKYSAVQPEKLSMKPSDYVRRQVWATFQDDPVGLQTHARFGAHNYMWASDFPHSDSTFPDSHGWIDRNFEGIPDAVRARVVRDNAVELYGMDL